MEKEIAEYLEYHEHHRMRTHDIKEYYMNLTPEKVADHLKNLITGHPRIGAEVEGAISFGTDSHDLAAKTHESELFILRNEKDLEIFEEGRKLFLKE
jgi:hypothetical protein